MILSETNSLSRFKDVEVPESQRSKLMRQSGEQEGDPTGKGLYYLDFAGG